LSHTTIFNLDTQIIEIKFQWIVTMQELRESFPEIIKIAIEKGSFLVLIDFLDAIVSFSTMDIYELPSIQLNLADQLRINAYKFKRALVAPKGSEAFSFLETVFLNRGHVIKLFHHVDEARNWLSG
jgi:hypothetical protein